MKKIIVLLLSVFLAPLYLSCAPVEKMDEIEDAGKKVKDMDIKEVEEPEDYGVKEECDPLPSLGKAPDFSLENMQGEEVKLSELKGKNVILFFWATWCPACVQHIGGLNQAYPILKQEGIELVGIGMGETASRIERFTGRMPIDFPVLLDSNHNVSRAYVIYGIPTFVMINKAGYVKFQNHFWPHDYEKYFCE